MSSTVTRTIADGDGRDVRRRGRGAVEEVGRQTDPHAEQRAARRTGGEADREHDDREERDRAEQVGVAHDALDATALEQVVARPVHDRVVRARSGTTKPGRIGARTKSETHSSKTSDSAMTHFSADARARTSSRQVSTLPMNSALERGDAQQQQRQRGRLAPLPTR